MGHEAATVQHQRALSRGRSAGPADLAAPSPVADVLLLQRQAGNRAVAALLASGRLAAQRACAACGCDSCRADTEDDAGTGVQRDVVDTMLGVGDDLLRDAVGPPYKPNPPWSSQGPEQKDPECTPFGQVEANMKWSFYHNTLPLGTAARCGCPAVGSVYARYFLATGGHANFTDPASCVNQQLAADDDAHKKYEDSMRARLIAALPAVGASVPPGTRETRPLGGVIALTADDFDIRDKAPNEIVFNDNTLAGGLLVGGIGRSEFGPDTHHVDGTVDLERVGNTINATVHFKHDLRDAVDFCPGNTSPTLPGTLNRTVLVDLSRLEASGMTRDVEVKGHYTRDLPLSSAVRPTPPTTAPAAP